MSSFDTLVQRYQQRLEVIRQVQELTANDPVLRRELAAALADEATTTSNPAGIALPFAHVARNGNGHKARTHLDQIKEYFSAQSNQWATAPAITKATGLSRGAVTHVLYKTHRDAFDQKDHPYSSRKKLWRIKDASARKEENGHAAAFSLPDRISSL